MTSCHGAGVVVDPTDRRLRFNRWRAAYQHQPSLPLLPDVLQLPSGRWASVRAGRLGTVWIKGDDDGE